MVGDAVQERQTDRRSNEEDVNNHLPKYIAIGELLPIHKDLQQFDGRDGRSIGV